MWTRFFLFLVIFSLQATPALYSQNTEFTKENIRSNKSLKKAKRLIKKGDKFYYDYEPGYTVALEYYLDAYVINPNSAILNYKIADCYIHSLEKFKALPYAEAAFSLNPQCAGNVRYVLGCAYQQKYEFDKAIEHFTAYRQIYKGSNNDSIKMAEKRIEECHFGKEMIVRDDYLLINMGDTVNSVYAEYVPMVRADESFLIFTGRRPPETDFKQDDKASFYAALYSEDVFMSKRIPGGWDRPQRLGPPINQPNQHNASVSLSPDGQTIYLYSEKNGGDIYYSTITLNEWTKPKTMGGDVNSKFNDCHISVSFDGKTAYLVSDRPGSIGGKDIWKLELIAENTWGNITNLGLNVNTEYDEDAVFIHPDGKTIYFSSRGHGTMGGFDIFEVNLDSAGIWGKPINMGYPINSPDDDIYFVLAADGRDAYLSSVKESGHGLQDLYMISPFEKKSIKDVKMVLFKGHVIDKESRERLSAKVEIVDNSTGAVMFSAKVDPVQGFLVPLPGGKNYGIAVESEGYVFHSENFDLVYKNDYDEVEKVIELQKVKSGAKLVLNNIFFDFDKWDLKQESQTELKRAIDLLNKYPGIKIEIEGHTDNYGSDEYNIDLSNKRANSVVEYLVANGFDRKRIVRVVAKGESTPVDTNDTKEGRAKNRRVEFNLVE